jgi:hypothetical protein
MEKTFLYKQQLNDKLVKYVYELTWIDPLPAFCRICGADPSRGCKCYSKNMQRAQISVQVRNIS